MKTTVIIGLGDMGSGLSGNLIKNGFKTFGLDLSSERMAAFAAMGGCPAKTTKEIGATCHAVFVMVMNGDQAKSVILGGDSLVSHMNTGGAVILTATIKPSEVKEIADAMHGSGIYLIDAPVSGGFFRAQNGFLIMMAAASDNFLDEFQLVMEAISGKIHRIGEVGGDGQTMKACLQTITGSIFYATFEAATLAAKAGVSGENLHKVVSTSGAGCAAVNTALENIIDRKLEGTGSHISTMYKNLKIALNLAEKLEVPMQIASSAMQIFHAGKSKYPQCDNWACARVIEKIVGVELHRIGPQL